LLETEVPGTAPLGTGTAGHGYCRARALLRCARRWGAGTALRFMGDDRSSKRDRTRPPSSCNTSKWASDDLHAVGVSKEGWNRFQAVAHSRSRNADGGARWSGGRNRCVYGRAPSAGRLPLAWPGLRRFRGNVSRFRGRGSGTDRTDRPRRRGMSFARSGTSSTVTRSSRPRTRPR
jgi:hypothetical protein